MIKLIYKEARVLVLPLQYPLPTLRSTCVTPKNKVNDPNSPFDHEYVMVIGNHDWYRLKTDVLWL